MTTARHDFSAFRLFRKGKGKLDAMIQIQRSLDGKAIFGRVIFAALERSLGLDACPNNDNRIALFFNFLCCRNAFVVLSFLAGLSGDYYKEEDNVMDVEKIAHS
jgi:hypothetical protein